MATRFLQGCSMGQTVPLKGLLRKHCDDTTITFGMSVLLTAFSVGSIAGPSLGGITAFPNQIYPKYFPADGLFARFPVLLPNLIASTGIAFGGVLAFLLLPRTNEEARETHEETTHLLQDGDLEESTKTASNNLVITNEPKIQSLVQKVTHSNIVKVMRQKEVRLCCLLFVLFAITDIGFEQLFPILASTDRQHNGMSFQPPQVGFVLMIVSIVQIVFQLTVLPKLSNRLGPRRLFVVGNIAQAIFFPLLPAVALLQSKEAMWVGLVVVIFLVRTFVFTGYLSLNIILNNSVDVALIGSANGVTMSVKYFGKILTPIMCGGIFSWSLHNIKGVDGNIGALGFPLDQFLAFIVLSLVAILSSAIALTLPSSVNSIDK